MTIAADGAGSAPPEAGGRLHHRFVTAEAIYGTILFCGVIFVAPDEQTDFEILATGILTTLVLWFAHVVAMSLARHGARTGQETGIRAAVADGLHHSTGMLIGPFVPLVFLLLGAFDVIDDVSAYWLAFSAGIAVLVVLGLVSCRERRVRWPLAVLGGLAAGGAGVLVVLMKAVLLE